MHHPDKTSLQSSVGLLETVAPGGAHTGYDAITLSGRQLRNQQAIAEQIRASIETIVSASPGDDFRESLALRLPRLLTDVGFDPSAYSPRADTPRGYGKCLLYHFTDKQYPFCLQVFCFAPGQETAVHDHPCECASFVVEGALVERRYDALDVGAGEPPKAIPLGETVRSAGSLATLLPSERNIHSLHNLSGDHAISVHFYNMDGIQQTAAVKQRFSVATAPVLAD